MRKLKEVLRLDSLGLSQRQIARLFDFAEHRFRMPGRRAGGRSRLAAAGRLG